MAITTKVRTVILLTAIAVLGILTIGYVIGHRRAESASNAVIHRLGDSLSKYIVEVDKKTLYVAEKEAEIKTLRQALRDGDVQREELRKLSIKQAYDITKLQMRIDTLLVVPHNGTVVTVQNQNKPSEKQSAMLLPFSFDKSDPFIKLKGTIDTSGLMKVNLRMATELDVWIVKKKHKDQPTVLATCDNPYLDIIGVRSLKLDEPKERRWGLGIISGYGINVIGTVKASPFLGVGISYDFVKFGL